MSAERRYEQRRFRLEESTTLNGGARTVFIEHMSPGTTVPPHYHTAFSETFDLISGSMSVFHTTTPSVSTLETTSSPLSINTPVTVPPGEYHKYEVGEEETTLRCIVTPGYEDFERLLKILNGLAGDGELEGMGQSLVLMAVIMDLSDAHLIGDAGTMLEGVRKEKAGEIAELKKTLLEKYDNEEQLKKLME
ncbi:hypothetical protein H072_500 [Dactylellina haptotyla CBS 200.50]|uniref:Cupin type-1 domain-containing protein n=1 Tax=Dactylellina haptotyla (strain CBS 200.50) TaxID=1284197 RepID=S8C153_DACHA|nr:hypothetical protein H072_500 [Dactylellina haptotyla CBS 200.50]